MITQVAQGITTKFTGSTLAGLVGNRLWRDKAKQNETMPYVVFTCISNDDYGLISSGKIEYHHIIFYIWTDDINPDTASTGLDALESALFDLFDKAILTITGWTNTGMIWLNTRPAISEDDNVIGVMMEFETYIEKS